VRDKEVEGEIEEKGEKGEIEEIEEKGENEEKGEIEEKEEKEEKERERKSLLSWRCKRDVQGDMNNFKQRCCDVSNCLHSN
jgi:hypothetical protein